MRTCFLAIAAALVTTAAARADIFAVAPIVEPGHSDTGQTMDLFNAFDTRRCTRRHRRSTWTATG